MRKSNFKPLLFTTTMRNPERIKFFLSILAGFNGQILTNELIKEICLKLFEKGLYRPTRASAKIKTKWNNDEELSITEACFLYDNNPQQHKEAGFDRGWPSRFDTWFKISKELGFVNYSINNPIVISDAGKMLLENTPFAEQIVFANAFAKYQRNNPFRRVDNENIPLILLLKVIQLLNSDKEYNNTGISRKELSLLICWQNSDTEALYRKIKAIRKKYGYTPSDEVILDECYSLLDATKRDDHSLMQDYPDEFIRKMKLTGLITIRGFGRFVDINNKQNTLINYIIKNYSNYKKYNSEDAYTKYMGVLDDYILTTIEQSAGNSVVKNSDLIKWKDYYSWNMLKTELSNLANGKITTDEILKFIEAPLRLEFLTSLAILKQIKNIEISPNYIVDDEGLPTSHAPGNGADIECVENKQYALVEVTLLKGAQQNIREIPAITRHLSDNINKGNVDSYSLFIAPQISQDSWRMAGYIKFSENKDIKVLNIHDFVSLLEQKTNLRDVSFSGINYF